MDGIYLYLVQKTIPLYFLALVYLFDVAFLTYHLGNIYKIAASISYHHFDI